MIDNLISGLVSGIIVVLLVLAFRAFWYNIIVPWFEERVYKDAKIEGKWFSLYPTTEEHRQETITLTRHGHAVTGTMVCTSGDDEGEQYQISGSFRNLILPLVYETQSKSKTDRGTITLKLIENAQKFRGKLAAYHTSMDAGHVSQRMLDRYSHIRLDAKRQALEALAQGSHVTSYDTKSGHSQPLSSQTTDFVGRRVRI